MLDIKVSEIKLSTGVKKNHMQRKMSQIFNLGLSYFMPKKVNFFIIIF